MEFYILNYLWKTEQLIGYRLIDYQYGFAYIKNNEALCLYIYDQTRNTACDKERFVWDTYFIRKLFLKH